MATAMATVETEIDTGRARLIRVKPGHFAIFRGISDNRRRQSFTILEIDLR
jgi:hypothetical protein